MPLPNLKPYPTFPVDDKARTKPSYLTNSQYDIENKSRARSNLMESRAQRRVA
jgi:hypothetical protein